MDTKSTAFADILAALRPLATKHATAHGERVGFFMADATRALGSLADASKVMVEMLLRKMVDGELVVIDGEVHTMYRLTDTTPPSLH